MKDDDNNYDVLKFLSLLGITSVNGNVDNDLIVSPGEESDSKIYIDIERRLKTVYCPNCFSKMYSKGSVIRTIKHPVLQNGKLLLIRLKQRKYRCTNQECNLYLNEEFGFVEKYKQTSVMLPYMILADMKDTSLTCAAVARRYQMSDTYVHSIMLRHLDFKPLALGDIISIDEVYLDIEYQHRYVVIVRDFITSNVIEVLPNRNYETIRRFFASYSYEERINVKYVISDMYSSYLYLTKKYLYKAESIIDSFHIIQILERALRKYIDNVKKRYQKKLDEERKANNYITNKDYKSRKNSPELYLLKRHSWVLLCKMGN